MSAAHNTASCDNNTTEQHGPSPAAVRAEIRSLVTRGILPRHNGEDLLARLGLSTQPTRWAVALTVPVAVILNAPNDHYAHRLGAGQLITALARLRHGYLTGPDDVTAPTHDPARRSLHRLTGRRIQPCPGYPAGGTYTITANALLAITVTAADADTARRTAHTRLTAEIDRLTGITIDRDLLRHLRLRQLTDLGYAPRAAG